MHFVSLHRSSLLGFSRTWLHSHARPRLRTRLKIPNPSRPSVSKPFSSSSAKFYATHRDTPSSSLLSQTLDQRQRMARSSQSDNVGPFTLGMVQQPLAANEQDTKKWSELNTKGKMTRATARTTNFTVIVLGAGFTAMLVYALASELFARNSPTVLYGKACERIKASEKVAQHIQGSLVFHNNPPTTSRPKHRNRNVSSQLAVDSLGREHLLLNFYVHGAHPGSSSNTDESYIDRAWRTAQEGAQHLQEMTLNETIAWGRETLRKAKEKARRLFLYLTGESASSTESSSYPYHSSNASSGLESQAPPMRKVTQIGRVPSDSESGGGFWSSLTGLFAGVGLRGSSSSGAGGSRGRGRGEESIERYEEGEVHCDLMKDENGNFVWRYIIVDMPNSRVHYPNRVFVERSSDVRDNEAVLRWY